MEISQIIPHVEALIFAADRPLPLQEIVDLLNNALAFLEDRTNPDQVETALEAIKEKYSSEFYAFEIRQSGGGYQFLTKKEYYQTVAQLNGDKFLKRLSTAALETLAIIAYRQPISKAEIEYIRGVSTDYSIQKLLEKELIVITGRSEDQPGKPLLYAVSRAFMDYFGIASVADLPKLKELFDEEVVQPTLMNDESENSNGSYPHPQDNSHHSLMVSEDGELLDPDHQLDQLSEEQEVLASEDEEVEPDDVIVPFDEIIEEVNEELSEEGPSADAENTASPDDTSDPEGDEDPDDIVEDEISAPQEDDEAEEEENEEDNDVEGEEEDDEDEDEEEEDDEEEDEEDEEDDNDEDEGDDEEEEEEDEEDEEDDDEEGDDDVDDDEKEDDEDSDNDDDKETK